MVSHLYQLGHRKIVFFSHGMEKNSLREANLKAFNELKESSPLMEKTWELIVPKPRINGELYPEVEIPDFSSDLATVFKTEDVPTACICQGEHVALEQALKKIGLKIPHDISLISTSNILLQNERSMPLTYICDRLEDICIKAALMMVELLDAETVVENVTVLVRPKLIIGKTTSTVAVAPAVFKV